MHGDKRESKLLDEPSVRGIVQGSKDGLRDRLALPAQHDKHGLHAGLALDCLVDVLVADKLDVDAGLGERDRKLPRTRLLGTHRRGDLAH